MCRHCSRLKSEYLYTKSSPTSMSRITQSKVSAFKIGSGKGEGWITLHTSNNVNSPVSIDDAKINNRMKYFKYDPEETSFHGFPGKIMKIYEFEVLILNIRVKSSSMGICVTNFGNIIYIQDGMYVYHKSKKLLPESLIKDIKDLEYDHEKDFHELRYLKYDWFKFQKSVEDNKCECYLEKYVKIPVTERCSKKEEKGNIKIANVENVIIGKDMIKCMFNNRTYIFVPSSDEEVAKKHIIDATFAFSVKTIEGHDMNVICSKGSTTIGDIIFKEVSSVDESKRNRRLFFLEWKLSIEEIKKFVIDNGIFNILTIDEFKEKTGIDEKSIEEAPSDVFSLLKNKKYHQLFCIILTNQSYKNLSPMIDAQNQLIYFINDKKISDTFDIFMIDSASAMIFDFVFLYKMSESEMYVVHKSSVDR